MRRLTVKRSERGAVAVWVALSMIPILGFMAVVVDVGLLYWEKGQLQNGADAAALAVAGECAEVPSTCIGGADSVATDMAGFNANDDAANADILDLQVSGSSGEVTVQGSTLNDGGNTIRHPFASLILPGETTVDAQASAEWGSPVAGGVLPLAIASCELTTIEPDDVGVKQIFLRSDNAAQDCPGAYPGGFGWLDDGDSNCFVEVGIDGWVEGTTGNNPGKTGCTEADFTALLGTTALVPIYSKFTADAGGKEREKGGAHGEYYIEKFAAFTVTGFKTYGGTTAYHGSSSPSFQGTGPDDCDKSGKCRGIRGYFVRWVAFDEAFELGDAPDGGITVVRMTG
ncbi:MULTISPECIES: pilus assembly protein TadG-related protein [unclassified Agromyces]|uniref:pilus assembly protein TadG-related protein n=1 Tax=unclassified Agromyces TaxID=2639701 RepID=UPI003015689C